MKILIIRRDNIGDLICTTPMFQALRDKYPEAYIAAYVNSYNKTVLQGNPYLNDVFVYTKAKHRDDKTSLWSVYRDKIRLTWQLRTEKFDYIILAGSTFTGRALKFAQILKPKHIIGYCNEEKDDCKAIDLPLPTASAKDKHETEATFALLEKLDIHQSPGSTLIVPAPEYCLGASEQVATAFMKQSYESIIGIHISARKPSSRWAINNYASLIQRLYENNKESVFLLFWAPGSKANKLHPGDDESAVELLNQLNGIPVYAFKTEVLEELIAGLSLCNTVICSDGGAMHIAAALSKPMVCFFGNSDASHWYPWGIKHRLIQPDSLDVVDVSVDETFRVYQTLSS